MIWSFFMKLVNCISFPSFSADIVQNVLELLYKNSIKIFEYQSFGIAYMKFRKSLSRCANCCINSKIVDWISYLISFTFSCIALEFKMDTSSFCCFKNFCSIKLCFRKAKYFTGILSFTVRYKYRDPHKRDLTIMFYSNLNNLCLLYNSLHKFLGDIATIWD